LLFVIPNETHIIFISLGSMNGSALPGCGVQELLSSDNNNTV